MITKRSLLIILFSLAILINIQASAIEVSGEVSGHWNVDTVKVTDDIYLESGQTLTVDPGVLIEFQGHYQF
ncbi:MAG: hypothetical protein JXA23_09245, partial [Bacteroidales bacterium]|nr:hypothetical protein [Bacteroidales bacterium]